MPWGISTPPLYEPPALTVDKLSACTNTGAGAGDGDGNGAGAGDGAGAGGDHGDGTGNGAGDGDGDGEPSSVRPVADQTIPVDSEGSTVGEEGEGEGERMDVEATQVCVYV